MTAIFFGKNSSLARNHILKIEIYASQTVKHQELKSPGKSPVLIKKSISIQ